MRLVAVLSAVVASMLVVPAVVRASFFDQFDLPGVGTGIPCDSIELGINHINTSGSGGSAEQTATVLDFTLLRTVDSYSPQLMGAVAAGAIFPTAEFHAYNTSKSTTIPYVTFDFEDLLVSSYSTAGSWDPSRPAEVVTLNYARITIHYYGGTPGDKKNPWGFVMPPAWPSMRNADGTVDLAFLLTADGPQLPAGAAPDFPFTPGQLRVTSQSDPNFLYAAPALNDEISPLGEVLPPTLPVPEPLAMTLASVGMLFLAGRARQRRFVRFIAISQASGS